VHVKITVPAVMLASNGRIQTAWCMLFLQSKGPGLIHRWLGCTRRHYSLFYSACNYAEWNTHASRCHCNSMYK